MATQRRLVSSFVEVPDPGACGSVCLRLSLFRHHPHNPGFGPLTSQSNTVVPLVRNRLCVSRITTAPPLAPFQWKFSREDFRTLLAKIRAHEKTLCKAA
jgi:hypothetical protein